MGPGNEISFILCLFMKGGGTREGEGKGKGEGVVGEVCMVV